MNAFVLEFRLSFGASLKLQATSCACGVKWELGCCWTRGSALKGAG